MLEHYLALFSVMVLIAPHSGRPSITLSGRSAGAALRWWSSRNGTDVLVDRCERLDDNERWSWTVLRVQRNDVEITVLLDDDIRVPVSDVALLEPPAFEVPF